MSCKSNIFFTENFFYQVIFNTIIYWGLYMLDNDKANIFSILSFDIVPCRFYVLIKIIRLYWLLMQYEF